MAKPFRYRSRNWKYQTNKPESVEQDNKGATDPRFRYPGLKGRDRYIRFVKDSLLRRANLAWCADQIDDQEYNRVKEMIESEDQENMILASTLLKAINKT